MKDYYSVIREERALSGIIEFKTKMDGAPEIDRALQDVAKEIDTVLTLDISNRYDEGRPPLKTIFDNTGLNVRINDARAFADDSQ